MKFIITEKIDSDTWYEDLPDDIVKKYVSDDGNFLFTDYVGDITKELESLGGEYLIKMFPYGVAHDVPREGPFFILPNGDFFDVAKALGSEPYDTMHIDLANAYVSERAYRDLGGADGQIYGILIDGLEYETLPLENFLIKSFRWIHCNSGSTANDDRFYCILPEHGVPSNSQLESLEEFFNLSYDENKDILVYFGSDGEGSSKTFNPKETLPEDIVKTIRRYYSSGVIYESNSKLKFKLQESFHCVGDRDSGVRITDDTNDVVNALGNLQKDIKLVIDNKSNKYILLDPHKHIHDSAIKLAFDTYEYAPEYSPKDYSRYVHTYHDVGSDMDYLIITPRNQWRGFSEWEDEHIRYAFIYDNFVVLDRDKGTQYSSSNFPQRELYFALGEPECYEEYGDKTTDEKLSEKEKPIRECMGKLKFSINDSGEGNPQ